MSEDARKPEEMARFFDVRVDGYDEHMRRTVRSFDEFYGAVARGVAGAGETGAAPVERYNPPARPARILDLGCGTGLELEQIFRLLPDAQVTCIDLSAGMLEGLAHKYADRKGQIHIIQDSYLTLPFGEGLYDRAVSVMSVHHLLPDAKRRLYEKIHGALRPGGRYVEGDYIVSQEEEAQLLAEYREQAKSVGEPADGYYHIDIPFSVETQTRILLEAGFQSVEVIWQEGAAAVMAANV